MAGKVQLEKVTELVAQGWKVLPPVNPDMMGAPTSMQDPTGKQHAVHEDGSVTDAAETPKQSPAQPRR